MIGTSKDSLESFGQKGSTLASLSILSDLEIISRRYWIGYIAVIEVNN